MKDSFAKETMKTSFNPFTPKSDQCQISPAASPEILHHPVWRTWMFIAYWVDKWLYYQFSLHRSYVFLLKGWENVLLELGSERVKEWFQISPAASPEILHHTVWRTWLFIAYSDERWSSTNSHYLTYTFLFKRLGECTFLTDGSKRDCLE